jgi:ribose 5-phosphate isomerase A
MQDIESEKKIAALAAVEQIQDGMIVGLGTGSTAKFAIEAIGDLVKDGLKIKGIPTSKASENLAAKLNIPLVTLNEVESIDLTIDGADEFDPDLNLIKGGGGALFREKIVAYNSKRVVIITDNSKKVDVLGNFPLPIEVLPFARKPVEHELTNLGLNPKLREKDGEPFLTDQGNIILDCHSGILPDCYRLAGQLNPIPGIVCHGLFLGLVDEIITATGEKINRIQRFIG